MTFLSMLRAVAWKLADRSLVMADWEGFCAECLPGDYPAGLLRWCSRLLASFGLIDDQWWIPYMLAGGAFGGAAFLLFPRLRRRWLPMFLVGGVISAFHSLWSYGQDTWGDSEPASCLMNLLGLTIAALLITAGRRFRSSPRASLAFVAICSALYPFFGLYPLLAGLVTIFSLVRIRRWKAACAAFALLVATMPAANMWLYGRLATNVAMQWAHAFRWRQGSQPALYRVLEMERKVRECDWKGVLELADAHRSADLDNPHRLEIAYRILAQFHLGRLPDDLFKYPIRTCHLSDTTDLKAIDGYMLLFGYGLLLPARCEVFERASKPDLEPGHLRVLGDIALIRGEKDLALRYYSMLDRCPFRGQPVARRLRFLAHGDTSGVQDLNDIRQLAIFMNHQSVTSDAWHYDAQMNIEPFVYYFCDKITRSSPKLMRLLMATSLLNGDETRICDNVPQLRLLYPSPSAWPKIVREALMDHAARLDPAERKKFLASLPSGAITPTVEERFTRYRQAAKQGTIEEMASSFGDTYYFYREFVCKEGE